MPAAPKVLTIDLLRHGATEDDDYIHGEKRLFGATDIPLSEKGKQQLIQAAHAIHQEHLTHIISSPLQRCRWLAEHHFHQFTPTFDVGFAEMDFGRWEGESLSTLRKNSDYSTSSLANLTPPDGESFTAFSRRVKQCWENYLEKHLAEGGHHLLITHGGVIRVILGMILHIPDTQLQRLFIPHASWSRISLVRGEQPMVWFINREA